MSQTHTNLAATRLGEEPIGVLVVGGDERVSAATSRLESLHERFRPSEVVVTDDTDTGEWLATDPNCIVCAWGLTTAEREAVLSTLSERDHHGRPAFLITDDPESCCASADTDVVTGYIERRRFCQDSTVARHILAAVESYRARRELAEKLQETERALDLLRSKPSRDEIGQSFCEFLTTERGYRGARIDTVDETGTLVSRWTAGDAVHTEWPTGPGARRSEQTADPGLKAFERNARQLVPTIDPDEGRWHAAAAGIESAIGVPIRHGNTVLGALSVYDDEPLDDAADSLSDLARTLGYGLRAAAWRESLLSGAPVVVEIEIVDDSVPLMTAMEDLPAAARLTVVTAVPHEETIRYVLDVHGVSPEEFVAGYDPVVESVTGLTDHPPRVELECERPTPETILADHAGQLVGASVTRDGITVAVAVQNRDAIERLVDAIEDKYANVSLRSVRSAERGDQTNRGGLFDRLTARQREILEFAYFNGYFERPREHTATELAEKLGLSRQTIAQHLRAGERKLFAELFDPDTE